MQLTETPEGKSSLQIRLNEAERRAHEAEVTAQDAQATLARTLLEAARVESVVMARIKAESEAEIEALRSELDAAKRLSATQDAEVPPAGETGGPMPDARKAAPPSEPLEYRPILLSEWDRSIHAAEDADDLADPSRRNVAGWPVASAFSPLRMVLPAIAAVFILVGYDAAGYLMAKRDSAPVRPAVASSTTEEASGANWLLYMPVERGAVAQYLGADVKAKRQLAVKSTPPVQQRN
jgi:hypothetical protein